MTDDLAARAVELSRLAVFTLSLDGTVEAWNPPPLSRRVAIKLYRAGLVGGETYSFKAERQALARLNHPNVGQIFEARTTEDGDPYLVMEYVPGMPITDYCDRYRLDLRQRIELFRAVCRGVVHVHQKGILHRDLKPANVLVMEQDGEAVPKIVDFGIAKGLDQPLAAGTVWSREASGTPAYVSPEVLAGGEADTRSDVYALGVILYQLLTGVLPAVSEAEILGQLCPLGGRGGHHPSGASLPRPSRRLAALAPAQVGRSAAVRGTGARALERALKGDLDRIAAKALAPDPEVRYAGVAGLADDLGRHLRAEPILAGPPPLGYRLARFARRHRAAVVAAHLGLLALLGGLVSTAWQARRAVREAAAAERARAEAPAPPRAYRRGGGAVSRPRQPLPGQDLQRRVDAGAGLSGRSGRGTRGGGGPRRAGSGPVSPVGGGSGRRGSPLAGRQVIRARAAPRRSTPAAQSIKPRICRPSWTTSSRVIRWGRGMALERASKIIRTPRANPRRSR